MNKILLDPFPKKKKLTKKANVRENLSFFDNKMISISRKAINYKYFNIVYVFSEISLIFLFIENPF